MKDAIGVQKCDSCRFYHRPSPQHLGCCIKNPPVPFVVGVVPSSSLVDPSKPGASMQPVVRAYFPPVAEQDGCGAHEPAEQRRMAS